MDIKSIAEGFAKIGLPILGAALPVPGGAAIGGMLASMIGSDSVKPEDILAKLTQDAQALERAKEFQTTHEETMVKIATDAAQAQYAAEVADRSSARTMQTATRSYTVPMLAFAIVGSFIGVVTGTLAGYAKIDSVLAGTLVGYLSAKCEQVVAFYFGSSKGSQDKTLLLHQSTPVNAS
jgi:hypothetical protein